MWLPGICLWFGVIMRRIGGLQVSWWISRANTFTGIGSKSTDSRLIARLTTILGRFWLLDWNCWDRGAVHRIAGAWPNVGHRTNAGFRDRGAAVQSGPIWPNCVWIVSLTQPCRIRWDCGLQLSWCATRAQFRWNQTYLISIRDTKKWSYGICLWSVGLRQNWQESGHKCNNSLGRLLD